MILIIFFCFCLQYNHFDINGDSFNLLALGSLPRSHFLDIQKTAARETRLLAVKFIHKIALFFALNRIISVQISFHLCYFCFK